MTDNAQIQPHKPYDKCIKCPYLGKRCDGPNPLAMVNLTEPGKGLERLGEWCRKRKEYLHTYDPKWTNAYIADEAQVTKTTVDRFLAGKADDIKISTLARVVKVLVNGTWGEYPCAMDEDVSGAEQCKKERDELLRQYKILEEKLAAEIEAKEKAERVAQQRYEQMNAKDRQLQNMENITGERADFLRRKDRSINILGACLAVAVIALVIVLGLPPIY